MRLENTAATCRHCAAAPLQPCVAPATGAPLAYTHAERNR